MFHTTKYIKINCYGVPLKKDHGIIILETSSSKGIKHHQHTGRLQPSEKELTIKGAWKDLMVRCSI